MRWRIEGHSLASKEYADRRQFVDEVLAPFAARFEGGEPFRPSHIRSLHADGDTVVDGTAFYDSISFNDLWTRVDPAAGGTSATG
jgi:uncharacterized protein